MTASRRRLVYCWHCLHSMSRSPNGALLARCSYCGSADTHVHLHLGRTTFTRSDVADAITRWRSGFYPEAAR